MQNHASTLAAEFKLDAARVAATVALIDEGNTIPFIARYRKEATGSMDDQTLRALDERLSYLRKLDDQKETVHKSSTEQGAMTPEIAAALEKAKTLAEVEDIYRPYKPKRKTRASIARARGLEPLAARLLEQYPDTDGIIAANDMVAISVYKELHRKGMRVPEDMQLIGFDNISLSSLFTPEITTIAQPIKRMGQEAVRMLTEYVAGAQINRNKVFDVKLIKRDTTL